MPRPDRQGQAWRRAGSHPALIDTREEVPAPPNPSVAGSSGDRCHGLEPDPRAAPGRPRIAACGFPRPERGRSQADIPGCGHRLDSIRGVARRGVFPLPTGNSPAPRSRHNEPRPRAQHPLGAQFGAGDIARRAIPRAAKPGHPRRRPSSKAPAAGRHPRCPPSRRHARGLHERPPRGVYPFPAFSPFPSLPIKAACRARTAGSAWASSTTTEILISLVLII